MTASKTIPRKAKNYVPALRRNSLAIAPSEPTPSPADPFLMMVERVVANPEVDVEKLRPIADRVGPTIDEIMAPLDAPPSDSTSLAFTAESFQRPW